MQFALLRRSTLARTFHFLNALPIRRLAGTVAVVLAFLGLGPAAAQPDTLYVDKDASGTGTGTSWTDAYTSLHDALADSATYGASAAGTEIWIAEGSYTPTDDPDIADTNRDTSFVVTGNQDSLEIYGGFASGDAFADRNPDDHPVVLSGDIDENDSDTTATGVTPTADDIAGDNSFHVLIFNGGNQIDARIAAEITSATVLDGVTVTGGIGGFNANFPGGGGLYCDGYRNKCSPTIRNAEFAGNSSDGGGAIYNNGIGGTSSPTITNSTFTGNSGDQGGAILNSGESGGTSNPTITDAVFSGNRAVDGGGAIYNDDQNGTSIPTIENATFTGNVVTFGSGGAIAVGGDATIRNATFAGNSASFGGGAISNAGNSTMTNLVFSGNRADSIGGAIYNGGSPTITNTTFSGNSAPRGGAIFNFGDPSITNTILWGNTATDLFGEEEVENDGGTPTFSYSIIAGSGGSGSSWDSGLGTDGGGNLDADPQFADPDGPDDSLGTEDDDLRIKGPGSQSVSPAIDAGDNSAISLNEDRAGTARKLDVGSVNDTGDGSTPLVDIGAYESTGAALPVELAGFDAQVDGDAVRLTWQTASEQNNAGFRVERRVGEGAKGRVGAWTRVGFVDGAGTTSDAQSYRFTDAQVPYEAGAVTYRLTQVDTDGATHVTETVTVERGVTEVQLLGTAPNPARQRATVRYALPEQQDVTLRLYDVLGRQVRSIVRGEQAGRHEQSIDVSGLSSGVYVLRLQSAGTTRTQKVTVVR